MLTVDAFDPVTYPERKAERPEEKKKCGKGHGSNLTPRQKFANYE
jgi:hypothetical protein